MTAFIDSHVHLDLLDDPQNELKLATDAGVRRMLAVGIDLESSRRAAKYASSVPGVNASVGIHPHEAANMSAEEINELEYLAGLEDVVAIGETGLDFFRDRSPRQEQKSTFIAHIGLARRTSRTLVVHSRDAGDETLEILAGHASGITVVLHCFAIHDRVEECASAGYFMSIAGNVTYKNAEALRSAAARIPSELLLSETDSPYLSPEPRRGRPNGPKNIPFIIDALASIRGTGIEQLESQIEDNYLRAFGLEA